uniref:Response regulatory domain-containing protein n=1 Tax=Spumella elongata TaxID=89044 RepID=A0A7S3M3C7_9STRA
MSNKRKFGGAFAAPTTDPAFKRLMNAAPIRNSLLSSILGIPISDSELVDDHLNPIDRFTDLRSVLSDANIELFKQIVSDDAPYTLTVRNQKECPAVRQSVLDLLRSAPQIQDMVPSPLRNTTLDLICVAKDEIVNVEIQVVQQNYWDLRVLDHACGLYHSQFPRSYAWSDLEKASTDKPRRVICISIFDRAPSNQAKVAGLIPWYKSTPWAEDETVRTIALTNQATGLVEIGGISFIHVNLHAMRNEAGALKIHNKGNQQLEEWLSFMAKAQSLTKVEAQRFITPEVHAAFDLLDISHMPPEIYTEVRKAEKMTESISFAIEESQEQGLAEGLAKGKAEGRAEGAAQSIVTMIRSNLLTFEAAKSAFPDPEVLEAVRRALQGSDNAYTEVDSISPAGLTSTLDHSLSTRPTLASDVLAQEVHERKQDEQQSTSAPDLSLAKVTEEGLNDAHDGDTDNLPVTASMHPNSSASGAPFVSAPASIAPSLVDTSTTGVTSILSAPVPSMQYTGLFAQKRILLVEDATSNHCLDMKMLAKQGHVCEQAHDGQMAVDMVQAAEKNNSAYDMILMDYEMPVMNGPTATAKLRELGFTLPIVGVTGNVLPADMEHFMAQGADAVLPKPLQLAALEAVWVKRKV